MPFNISSEIEYAWVYVNSLLHQFSKRLADGQERHYFEQLNMNKELFNLTILNYLL